MSSVASAHNRVLSGMRPTGQLHLGHYHGVLRNWVKMQHEYDCFFFVADWHALTTHYDNPAIIEEHTRDLVIDWLGAGVNPSTATMFVQSAVPEHAELHLLLSMITPLGWLERVPSFKDQQERFPEKNLSTYGFLGYPLLQSADILIYQAGWVPVGEDQVAHIELTREIARRFNFLYGRETDFEEKVQAAIRKMSKKNAKRFGELRNSYREQGDKAASEVARELIINQQNITIADRDRLLGYIEGDSKAILPEPQPLLSEAAKMPGLDGQKMSKSYNNTITLRDTPKEVEQKLRTMQTDPARIRLTDPGEPERCPVWPFHKIYSTQELQTQIEQGCRTAEFGCLDCKKYIIEAVQNELAPIQERMKVYQDSPELVRNILNEGGEKARDEARKTLDEVNHAMGLDF